MILRIKIFQCLSNHETQLDFIMHIHALGEQHRALTRQQQGRSRLEKEEGLFRFEAVEFGDVVSTFTRDELVFN